MIDETDLIKLRNAAADEETRALIQEADEQGIDLDELALGIKAEVDDE